jgi:hypothetical protein
MVLTQVFINKNSFDSALKFMNDAILISDEMEILGTGLIINIIAFLLLTFQVVRKILH